MMNSYHWRTDRENRRTLIETVIGLGHPVDRFTVDRGHRNGPEIHEISDTGIITVYNARTHLMVTRLVGRPSQIRRYYKDGKAPEIIIKRALENQRKGYNEM